MRKLLQMIDQTSVLFGKTSSLLTLFAALVVVYEVIMRHFLHLPTLWASEFTSMACSALYFLGGAWVLYQKKHVNIEMIYERFSPRGKVISDLATYGFFAIYTGMMTWHSSIFALESIQLGETTSSPWNPFIYPSKLIMAFGFMILFLQGSAKFVRDLYLLVKGKAL
jgi:TRAP-type mannitol/chloroaromatic compound transport system permease small subunit